MSHGSDEVGGWGVALHLCRDVGRMVMGKIHGAIFFILVVVFFGGP